jgi:hypothetical protein
MASRSGARFVGAKFIGVAELEAFLRDQIAGEDLNPAKRDLRQGTKVIANDILIPALKDAAESSGVPIASRIAATARTRTDRFVTVTIGRGVNPKLSGYKRGSKQSWRTSLAWGSDLGPHPDAPRNRYGVPRNPSGYWARSTISRPDIFNAVKDAYQELLGQILNDYGKYR